MNSLKSALTSIRARLKAADSGPWRGHGFAIYSESELSKETDSYVGEIRNDFDRALVINCHHDLRQLCDALEVLWIVNEFYANHESVIKEAYHSNDEKQITVVHTFINHKAVEARAKVEAIFGKEGV